MTLTSNKSRKTISLRVTKGRRESLHVLCKTKLKLCNNNENYFYKIILTKISIIFHHAYDW